MTVARLALLGLLLAAGPARAQLLSPGPLTRAHASLEGIRNCTQCHQLGRRGVDPARCLSCHAPIATRIRERRGLHGRQAERDCGSCHSDHHGRDFNPDRFATDDFDHTRRAGFALVGQHRTATCRSCHTPAFITDAAVRRQKAPAGRLDDTFLGVASDCQSCHARDNPHSRTVPTDCQTCHTPADWNRVPDFDHAATGFRLTGGHARASCASCHGAEGRGAARFRDLPQTCTGCHASDSPHGRQFAGQTCASCHTTARWAGADAFDHARTDFPLTGSHARIDCASCHGSGRSAQFSGVSARCLTCHADDSPHGDQFAGRECSSCHGPTTWASAPAFSHDRTDFPLVGQHARVACASCHPSSGGRQQFVGVEAASCQSCHDDAHDGALGADCATCHAPTGWDRIDRGAGAAALSDRFDHAQHTGFALVGAHAGADCSSCHGTGRAPDGLARRDDAFQIALAGPAGGATFPALRTDGTCLGCHTDAHDGHLADLPGGADCASCHSQDAFAPATFDRARHEAEAGFALVGAHAVVPCGACHTRRGDAPPDFGVEAACQSCHAADSPHGDQFARGDGETACADCHATDTWDAAAFDHAARTGFALTGAHATADCQSCHARPAGGATWTFAGLDATCATCHAGDDPHAGQFATPEGPADCATCHDTAAFTLRDFDHERTAFSLVGAHAAVACASCHQPERLPDGTVFIRFKPLPTDCAGCHAGR